MGNESGCSCDEIADAFREVKRGGEEGELAVACEEGGGEVGTGRGWREMRGRGLVGEECVKGMLVKVASCSAVLHLSCSRPSLGAQFRDISITPSSPLTALPALSPHCPPRPFPSLPSPSSPLTALPALSPHSPPRPSPSLPSPPFPLTALPALPPHCPPRPSPSLPSPPFLLTALPTLSPRLHARSPLCPPSPPPTCSRTRRPLGACFATTKNISLFALSPCPFHPPLSPTFPSTPLPHPSRRYSEIPLPTPLPSSFLPPPPVISPLPAHSFFSPGLPLFPPLSFLSPC
ncbi:unnamed protein product [Closterium sp. Naga37s-1]|nr:unnamed protein product [Closterium sp. Naga37s-1]